MLPTEVEKLESIHRIIVDLSQETLRVNQEILAGLENCDQCKLDNIQPLTKKDRYNKIDALDNLIINVFALYTPEARDLRELVAFIKITNEFDRILNSCNSFIRDFPQALEDDIDKATILEYAIPLQKASVTALEHALEMLKTKDSYEIDEHYSIVVVEESKNDDLYKIIEKTLLKQISDDLHLTRSYQDIMSALRRLEKVADRALSIANLLHYAKVGGEISKV
jgi:phosphate transport system protein